MDNFDAELFPFEELIQKHLRRKYPGGFWMGQEFRFRTFAGICNGQTLHPVTKKPMMLNNQDTGLLKICIR